MFDCIVMAISQWFFQCVSETFQPSWWGDSGEIRLTRPSAVSINHQSCSPGRTSTLRRTCHSNPPYVVLGVWLSNTVNEILIPPYNQSKGCSAQGLSLWCPMFNQFGEHYLWQTVGTSFRKDAEGHPVDPVDRFSQEVGSFRSLFWWFCPRVWTQKCASQRLPDAGEWSDIAMDLTRGKDWLSADCRNFPSHSSAGFVVIIVKTLW